MKVLPMSIFTLAFSGYIYMQAVDTAMTTLKRMEFMMSSAAVEMNTAGNNSPATAVSAPVTPAVF